MTVQFAFKLIALPAVLALIGFSASAATDSGTKKAQSALRGQVQSAGALSSGVKSFVVNNLISLTGNSVFTNAVSAQNAKGMSLAQIKQTDKAWINAEEPLPIQEALMSNPCAAELNRVAKKFPAIIEAFVMDNQGAVVCENALTSDYWQGDEAKWKNSFAGGNGGVDAGEVEFDKSANTTLQQVSLPIFDKNGAVIGAVTFGLAVGNM